MNKPPQRGVLYEPKGRAAEYAPLALNLYETCPHSCTYCYVPAALHKPREDFHQIARARPRVLQRLYLDCQAMRRDPREILLCFACDPYPLAIRTEDDQVTRQALLCLERFGMKATILTKGGLEAERDFDILSREGWSFGVTLTGVRGDLNSVWWHYEQGASSPWRRLELLKQAHDQGIRTWASIEPVMSPSESLDAIRASGPHVDHFKLGKLNHNPKVERETHWPRYLASAIDSVRTYSSASFYVKEDLRKVTGWTPPDNEPRSRR